MIVLGIETATNICAVALTQDGQLICEFRSNLKNAHAKILAGAIEKIMHDARLQMQDIDGIAVSIGPGSFTGLRIGLATAKGIAFAMNCPIVAVPTLEALAYQAPIMSGTICPIIRSRSDEVYAALFQRENGKLKTIKEVTVLRLIDLPSFAPKDVLLIGTIQELNKKYPIPDIFQIAPEETALLSGFTIARFGTERLARGEIEDLDLLEPKYSQEFQVGKPKEAVLGGHAL